LGEALAAHVIKEGTAHGQATTVCLHGELGAGKTTFAQGFAKGLGVTTRLLSPTFIIVRRYELKTVFRELYHIDLYRVGSGVSHEHFGFADMFADPKAAVLVEWPEYLGEKRPTDCIDVEFKIVDEATRRITIK
jgi:tRNA threonylcarbamoyladenosine biosynthesis protein TsaE